MLPREPLLVTLVKLVDRIPMPPEPERRGRGRPRVYSDRIMVKALVIMVIRRLYTAYSLLAFLEQETALTNQLRDLLKNKEGKFPVRRTWERRLAQLPDTLPGLIGCLGRHLGSHGVGPVHGKESHLDIHPQVLVFRNVLRIPSDEHMGIPETQNIAVACSFGMKGVPTGPFMHNIVGGDGPDLDPVKAASIAIPEHIGLKILQLFHTGFRHHHPGAGFQQVLYGI